MQIRNILVAVDGSENSDRALDFALGLAEKYGASIVILNVFEAQVISADVAAASGVSNSPLTQSTPDFSKYLRNIHEAILTKNVAHAKTANSSVAVSSMLREGEPALEIVNAAKEGGFDVIVVGHGGASRMSELLLGSVSEKVAHFAPCSVIIVK